MEIITYAYAAHLSEADFEGQSGEARAAMNTWISEHTAGRIEALLAPGDLSPDTVFLLANTLVFDAEWAQEFDPKDTRESSFYLETGETVEVPMMRRKGTYRVSQRNHEAEVLRLPYHDGRGEMVLVVPAEDEPLESVERLLSTTQIDAWLAGCETESLEVSLPRFTGLSTIYLNEALSHLSMPCAFEQDCADFTGMIEMKSWLKLIKHGCYVEVDEKGTEAAAATVAVGLGGRSGGSFAADRPFLYFIRDTGTGAILLMGRVMNPLE